MDEIEKDGGMETALLRRHLRALEQEIQELRRSVDELTDARESDRAVAKRLRRMIQDAHLRERHLRRQIDPPPGAAAPPGAGETAPARRVDPRLVLRAMEAPEPPDYWAPPEAVLEPLAVHPGWAAYERAGEEGVVLGFSLLGLDGDGRRRVVDLVLRQQETGEPLLPVFITDDDDFDALRRAHFVFEYLPPWPGPEVVADPARWDDYLVERLVFIRRKWGIRRYLSFAAGAFEDDGERIGRAVAEAEAAAAAEAAEARTPGAVEAAPSGDDGADATSRTEAEVDDDPPPTTDRNPSAPGS